MIQTIHNPGKRKKKAKRARGRAKKHEAVMAKKKKKRSKSRHRRNPARHSHKRRAKRRKHRRSNPGHARHATHHKKRRGHKRKKHHKKHRRNPEARVSLKSLAIAGLAGLAAGAVLTVGAHVVGQNLNIPVTENQALLGGAAGAAALGLYVGTTKRRPLLGVGIATGALAAAGLPLAVAKLSSLVSGAARQAGLGEIGAVEFDRMGAVEYSDGRRRLGLGEIGAVEYDRMNGVDTVDMYAAGGNPY